MFVGPIDFQCKAGPDFTDTLSLGTESRIVNWGYLTTEVRDRIGRFVKNPRMPL